MSEKLYFITAKTKGENPVVLFLNDSMAWSKYAMVIPLLGDLHDCQSWAEDEPTHCLFVEAKDSLRKKLKGIMYSKKNFVTPAELKQLIKEHDCHTVSTEKEKPAKEEQRQPTQDAAEEQPQKRIGYVVFYSDVDGNKEYKTRNWGNPTEVFRTPEDAQFAADVLDSDIDTERGWKVERIEF